MTKAKTVLGKALKTVTRDRYILATKVGQYDHCVFDFSAERVTRSVEESMQRLNVDYIDLIQVHDIEYAESALILGETVPALQKLNQAGRIGHIGITGLPLTGLRKLVAEAGHGAIETILFFCPYTLQDDASPVSMGLHTERGAPDLAPVQPNRAEDRAPGDCFLPGCWHQHRRAGGSVIRCKSRHCNHSCWLSEPR